MPVFFRIFALAFLLGAMSPAAAEMPLIPDAGRLVALPETRIAYQRLHERLSLAIEAFNRGTPEADLKGLLPLLTEMEAAVRREAESAVPTDADSAKELEAFSAALFGVKPVLPPERKDGENWRFEPVRFEVVPDHLYIFELTFKASRTIRLKKVTLFFHDGGHIEHAPWENMEGGNGKEFRKRIYVPWLKVFTRDEVPRARALAAVEILGSAQDAGFSSDLEFKVRIPDLDEAPHRQTLDLLGDLHDTWTRRSVSADHLNRCLLDLKRLAPLLGLSFSTDVVAVSPR
ncbi:hypothetical protein SCOR_18145 [Sulfidibacter corallicola]|uniref:Uncharacterized protein n=1 Tax=Sulfidibacter corallicola TaxID=2818388 RepID=A0A8A4TWX8_SULCO|nr:hypothetical protein [Sulfidibacter corallicola]QTD53624.1 hypothetical protein J3U87_14315 [Sulfidibacter corallicola]